MKAKELKEILMQLNDNDDVLVNQNWENIYPIDKAELGYYFPETGDAMDVAYYKEDEDNLSDLHKESCAILYLG